MELFGLAQIAYAACNLVYLKLLLKKPNYVDLSRGPQKYRNIDVLIAAYEERYEILYANVKSLMEQDYPPEKVKVHIVVEAHDKGTVEAARRIAKEFGRVDVVVIPRNRHENWEGVLKHADIGPEIYVPAGKGRALLYALHHAKTSKQIVGVFDSEDVADPRLFKAAVSGLEQGYDIVQGLLKYGNWRKSWLTALQSAEPVIWSKLFYPSTSHKSVPFQVLGPAYFFDYKLAHDQKGWSPFTTSEDVQFGVSAWLRKKKLGIIDIYTSEMGVETYAGWLAQRRRWARGHQEHFVKLPLSIGARLNFFTYTINSQVINLVGLVGVPTGVYLFIRQLLGMQPFVSDALFPLLVFNMAMWLGTSLYIMGALLKAYDFKNWQEKLGYVLKVNPLTLLFYSLSWSLPVLLGFWDNIVRLFTGKMPAWEKTAH
jgi:cellulose synthase/poly-beta-1,6-N-acetylglucosamine synthase-like glycosyltransferase